MENNTTPNAIAFSEATSAFLSETNPEPLSELERWQYLLSALGHDYNARIVCESHIEELLGDYEGVEHIEDVNGISEERYHTLGDFNVFAGATVAELERRQRLISQWKEGPQREQDKVIRDLRRDLKRIDESHTKLWDQLGQATEKTQIFENLIRDTVSLIEQYADDHNSTHPTDVTVILPRLRATFAMAKYEGWVKDWLKQQDLFSE